MIKRITSLFAKQATHYFILACLSGLVLHWLTPNTFHGWDSYCWMNWASAVFHMGLQGVYTVWNEYLPLFQYLLKVYVLFLPEPEMIGAKIQYFKLFSLLFHLMGGYFLLLIVQKHLSIKHPLLKMLLYLFNLGILYNGLVWGQVDIILSFFVLLAYYFILEKKISLALVSMVAAINFKIQAIVFFPPAGLLLLPMMIQGFKLRNLFKWIVAPLLFQIVILIPFIIGGTLPAAWAAVTDSFSRYQFISMNAFNFWYLLFPSLTIEDPDTLEYLGITYKHWGVLLFCASSLLALWPLLKNLWIFWRKDIVVPVSVEKTLLIFSVIPFLFFYFNTEMHERYAHPGLLFLMGYGIRTGRFFLPLLASWAYFFNLEAVMRVLGFQSYETLLFHPVLISVLWLVTIIGLLLQLYDIRLRFFVRRSRSSMLPPTHLTTD